MTARIRRTHAVTAALLVLAFAGFACSHTPTGPEPGTLTVMLNNPNSGTDGAILLTLSGPTTITNAVALGGDTLWTTDFSSTAVRVLLTGSIRTGAVLHFNVPDVNVYQSYLVTVNQAVRSADYGEESLAQYTGYVQK